MKNQTTVDDVVRMAIEDLFPNHIVPDQRNHIRKGWQHKAPDHLIMDGAIAIERKSRNAVDRSQFYKKLQEIATEQGYPFWGVGKLDIKAIIRALPDPEEANKRMADFMMNQTMKTVRSAHKKFVEYAASVPRQGQIRVLIISDNTTIRGGTASIEYRLGRRMGALPDFDDEFPIIDSIFYIKDPRFTLDEENSYWFKALVRNQLEHSQFSLVSNLSTVLHHRVMHYGPYFDAARRFKISSLQHCLV